MVSGSTAPSAATFLFCHGGSFCKEVWTPIVTRLQQSPLIQKAAPNMVSFDFPYHGSNRDVSQPATVHLENPQAPRVSHAAMNWGKWSKEAVQRQVQLLHAQDDAEKKTPLIGIGHSMGGAALWAAEAANPGTFDALILFEPMLNIEQQYGGGEASVNFFVAVTLKRKANWETFEEAEREIMAMPQFAKWHPESLKHFIKGAVVKASPINNVLDPDGKYVLACHPLIEASGFCVDSPTLSEEEMAGVKCPITIVYGDSSQMFSPVSKLYLAKRYPHLYRMAAVVPNTTHTLVMEDPDTVASRIVESLSELPLFKPTSAL